MWTENRGTMVTGPHVRSCERSQYTVNHMPCVASAVDVESSILYMLL